MPRLISLASSATLISLLGVYPPANAETTDAANSASDLATAIAATEPIFGLRLRFESAEQDNALQDADALTYRMRAGFKTGEFWNTTLLVEFDHIQDIAGDFNPDPFTPNANSGVFSVIPDPNATELNRFQLVNTSLPNTKVTLGRQVLNLDDQRFVGSVGWRQNDQTIDGVRIENTSFGDLNLDATYLNGINRIFGDDSNVGTWEGDSYLVNASHPTPLGKLTGFAYFVDVDNAGGVFSNQTLGARLAGKQELGDGKLAYTLSYATQQDYGSSNLDYSADFISVDGHYAWNKLSAGAGYEVLGGDTQRGFQTPLATLHKFNGWADVFLNTPATGLEDLYVKAGFAPGDVGLFKKTKFSAIYHDFSADQGGADYGSEFNFVAKANIDKVGLLLKFADYSADTFAVDTQKFWVQLDYAF